MVAGRGAAAVVIGDLLFDLVERVWASDGTLSILGRAASMAYPTADVLLIALLARLLIGAGVHNAAFRLLASSLVIMLVGDIGFAVLAELGAFTNDNVINITWLLAYVLFGAAALHPSMAKLSERAMEPPRRFTRKRLSLLTSVSLVAPVLLLAQTWWHGGVDTAAIGIGAIVLFLLVVARMSGLIRQVEEQAARLETLAQHDPLTGAANRRAWDHNLPVEMDRPDRRRRRPRPLPGQAGRTEPRPARRHQVGSRPRPRTQAARRRRPAGDLTSTAGPGRHGPACYSGSRAGGGSPDPARPRVTTHGRSASPSGSLRGRARR